MTWATALVVLAAAQTPAAPEADGPHREARVAAGPAYVDFAGLAAVAGVGSLDLALGRYTWLTFNGMWGRTRGGLSLARMGVGAQGRWQIERVTLGLGPDIGVAWYVRATTGSSEPSLYLGGQAMVGIDVAKVEATTLVLAAELRGSKISAGALWTPALTLGARF